MSDDFWLLHADGASLGNPGPGGAGAVLYDESGQARAEISLYLGSRITNNEAEYQGLLSGLKKALELGAQRLQIRMDSELVVRQVLGIYKVKNARLAVFFQEVKELLAKFDRYEIAHVRREYNSAADALASKAARKKPTGAQAD
ncbi:MAG: ribonuclease HI family protein [Candidatus Adiutrix sp.]|jgi:ribonuclease HI|nr:ribonuclease HI family protein [Candidatus Adiutrix sp.]